MANLLSRLATMASKAAPPPANSLFAPAPNYGGFGGVSTYPLAFPGWPDRTGSGPMSPESRSRMALMSAWVYSDVQVIARRYSTGILQIELQDGEEKTPVISHPLENIWKRPNLYMGRNFLMQFWAWSLLAGGKGEAYLFAAPGEDGKPAELWPVPPSMINPVGNEKEFISHFEFKSRPNEKPLIIDPAYIVYSHLPNPFDLRRGLDPMLAMAMAVETDLATGLWNKNFFGKRNGVPTALVTLPAQTSGPDFERIKGEIFEFFGGGKREVAVTRSGDLGIEILAFNAEQMQIFEGRKMYREEIDRAFGFPEGYWTARASRANSDHGDAVIDNDVAWPLLIMQAEDINAQMVARWYGENETASFVDIRSEDVTLKRAEIDSRKDYWTVDELRAADPPPAVPEDKRRYDVLVSQVKAENVAPTPYVDVTPTAPDSNPVGAETEHTPTQAESAESDTKRWQDKALKRFKSGRGASVAFASDYIAAGDHARIAKGLESCKSIDDIRRVFNANSDLAGAARELARAMDAARETLGK